MACIFFSQKNAVALTSSLLPSVLHENYEDETPRDGEIGSRYTMYVLLPYRLSGKLRFFRMRFPNTETDTEAYSYTGNTARSIVRVF